MFVHTVNSFLTPIMWACRNENTGEGVGAKMAKALDAKNYQLVITGHSLGAGTAALVGLKLKDRFPGHSLPFVVLSTRGFTCFGNKNFKLRSIVELFSHTKWCFGAYIQSICSLCQFVAGNCHALA